MEVFALHDLDKHVELFARYSHAYWFPQDSTNEEPIPDPHRLASEEYEAELSKYEKGIRELLKLDK